MPSIHSKSHKSYSLGDIITTCEPLFHVIYSQFKGIRCDFCHSNDNRLKKCSNCRQMFYCDQNCQKNDWVFGHKNECKIYAKYGHEINALDIAQSLTSSVDQFPPFERLLIRFWFAFKSDKTIASKVYQLANNEFLSLNDLETHYEDIDTKGNERFELICHKFKRYGIDFDRELLYELYYKASRFALFVEDIHVDNEDIVTERSNNFLLSQLCAIYIPIAVYNQSCAPNTWYVLNGKKLQLRAIKPIAVNEEITISYVPLNKSKSDRKHELSFRFIDCHCLKCDSDFDEKFDYQRLEKLKFDQMREMSNCLKSPKRMIQILEETIKLLKLIYGDFHPVLTYRYMDLNRMLNMMSSSKEGLDELRVNVENCIKITHGKDHVLYQMFTEVNEMFDIIKTSVKSKNN